MSTQLILTVMADDQPGIVKKLSECVAMHDGNWLESRMTRMAGKFAGIIRIDCHDDKLKSLHTQLDKLISAGIRVIIDYSDITEISAYEHIRFTVTANDRTGIVKEVSNVLAGLGVNMEDLETLVESAPMFSGLVFTAEIVATLPESMEVQTVVDALEQLSDDLIVDILE
ncbi:glycine cleavage system protein R [Gynuella sunshinyii]|uniref:Glycine cleavage system transcriptional repressor n=1 Tax=Gynuella sunshinyii YC6258 TaxID=1445510 RepID=A0A0C5VB22_9GAMM|nr:ACT domain-containing protein [Gynuella sunshinyii]AJQ96545.1 glycine cleavage system regulatory protein [Gynuella sunshinyii YC6258]